MIVKPRALGSLEDAVSLAIGLLTSAVIAKELGVSTSMVVKWSDADNQANRIGLHQALAIEALLIRAGHAPVFAELFTRLLPSPPAPAQEPPDPLREAMRATKAAADLMEGVDKAMVDGVLSRHELGQIESLTHKLQKQIAWLRRVVRKAMDCAPTR